MKKIIIFAAAAMALAGCGNQTTENNDAQKERDSLQAIIANKDTELNEFMGVFAEIQESLSQMSEAEGRVHVASSDPERVNKVEQIREDMTFLGKAAQQQRERIAKLKEKLGASTLNVQKMQEALDNLQKQLDEQTARVQELQVTLAERDATIAKQIATIGAQDNTIVELNDVSSRQAQEISQQDKQLNEAWYVFGTKSELKAQKIIDDGEVLKSGRFNKDYFTQIDIRNMKELQLYSKKAKMLTSHPQNSYTLLRDAKGEYVLKITDTQAFWSLSRYLVIQVR